MKLSVIIPCYNSKNTIAIQLEALPAGLCPSSKLFPYDQGM